MRPEALKKAIRIMYKERITTLIVGHPGIGKSSLTKQICEEEGLERIDLRAGQLDMADFHGLLNIRKDENGNPIYSEFIPPKWWPKEGTKGLLVLDEINRAREDVQQGLFQLILDFRLHEHILPKGWGIVAIVNPDTADHVVNDLSDSAWFDRFWQVTMTPKSDDFVDYQLKIGNEKLSNFIRSNPDIYNKSVTGEDFSLEVKTTPRSLEMANKVFPYLDDFKFNTSEKIEILSGFLSSEDVNKFYDYFSGNLMFNIEDVLNKEVKLKNDVEYMEFMKKLSLFLKKNDYDFSDNDILVLKEIFEKSSDEAIYNFVNEISNENMFSTVEEIRRVEKFLKNENLYGSINDRIFAIRQEIEKVKKENSEKEE